MAMVINLRERPHHPAQCLLPWYLNGTLDETDAALVEAHLADCGECRAELDGEVALAAGVAGLSVDQTVGRLAPAADRPERSAATFLRRRVPLGWALAAQAAAAFLVAIFLPGETDRQGEVYHALGSETRTDAGNVIVLFAPETRERAVRKTLSEAGARVVDGPTASGAYVLRVPRERKAAALERLRADPGVTLAEPIGRE
jgi:anti-sigma factor RsiW